jgi:hypothetical protein
VTRYDKPAADYRAFSKLASIRLGLLVSESARGPCLGFGTALRWMLVSLFREDAVDDAGGPDC